MAKATGRAIWDVHMSQSSCLEHVNLELCGYYLIYSIAEN